MPKFYGIKNNSNYVIKDDNTLWEIGRNRRFNTLVPMQITSPGVNSWKQLLTVGNASDVFTTPCFAIKSDNTLWAWGANSQPGQLGIPSLPPSGIAIRTPVQVGTDSDWAQVSTGMVSSGGIKTNGTLWTWGIINSYLQIGNNTTSTISSPMQLGTLSDWAQVCLGPRYITSIKTDGTMWAWGQSPTAQGNNTNSSRNSPVQVGTLSNWAQITTMQGTSPNTAAITSNGQLWICGYNDSGQLGVGNATARSSFVQVGTESNWYQVAGAFVVCAVKTDGTLWAWGGTTNRGGTLGLNTTVGVYSPVQVGTLSNWNKVVVANDTALAIKTDGTLWAWGNAPLGNNSTGTTSSPIQIGTLSNWAQISSVNNPNNTLFALNSNGTLYSWTSSSSTAVPLGYDNTSYRSSAIQVGSSNTWVGFPTGSQNSTWSAVLNTNGGLYIFGDNSDYLLDYEYYQADTLDTVALGTNIINPVPVDSTSNTIVSQATFGDRFGTFIRNDGALWSWGSTSFGQIPITFPLIPGLVYKNNWSQIAGGNVHTAALQSNGTLWTCGYNASGQLGLSDAANRSSFVQVGTDSNWSKVSLGNLYTTSIKTDNTLWVWGNNSFGQLGLSDLTNRSTPVQVGTLSDWSQISNGVYHSAAIKTDNTLWVWGNNSFGQLGLSNITNRFSPVQVGALSNWAQVACGYFSTAAVKVDGTLWTWGSNSFGQLGLSNLTSRSSPVQMGALSNWSQIGFGNGSMFAIKTDSTLWSWGNNSFGQLGTNTTTRSNVVSPVQIGSLSDWSKIGIGVGVNRHSAALNSSNQLYVWGNNSFGQLGISDLTHRSSPVRIGALSNWTSIVLNGVTSFALDSNSLLWSWGAATYLGYTGVISPIQIGSTEVSYNWKQTSGGGFNGGGHVINIKYDGTLWSCGYNTQGQLGLSDTTNRSNPVQVGLLSNWNQSSCSLHTAVIKTDGTLWAWGRNDVGQLGQSDTTNRSSPVQIGTESYWSKVSCLERATIVIKTDGTLWGCGYNLVGNLGLNDTVNRSSLVQIGTLSNWNQIAGGGLYITALKTDGTLWAWGYNSAGQLGLSNTTNRSSPVQVGTESYWSKIASGQGHSIAINSLGQLYSWGSNNWGQLGLSDTTDRSSPIQVGTLSNWNQVACSYVHTSAIKTDGTLWTWGRNSLGQLGTSFNTNSSSPIQVGTQSNWTSISTGYHFTQALNSDNVLWNFGYNQSGALGNNTFNVNFVTPTRLTFSSVATNWSKITSGLNHTLAIKTDNTLWSWGNNSFGQLGLSDVTHRSSIVQIGLANNWAQIACGQVHSVAINSQGFLYSWGNNSYAQLGQPAIPISINVSTPIQVGSLSNYSNVFCTNFTTLANLK
jgi:alpha-tubulin suppressor-like RCC1 family protein